MDSKPIFHIETTTGDVLNSIKKISSIIRAKGGYFKGKRLIFLEVNDGLFRIYVDSINDSIPTAKVTGKGKISLNFNSVFSAIKTYPKSSVVVFEAYNNFLLVNGSLQLNEQYSNTR